MKCFLWTIADICKQVHEVCTLSGIPLPTVSTQVRWHLLNTYQLNWNMPTMHGSRSVYGNVENDRRVKVGTHHIRFVSSNNNPPPPKHDITTYIRCRIKRLPNFKQLLNDLLDAYPHSQKAPITWTSKFFMTRGPNPLLRAGSRFWCGKITVKWSNQLP